MTKLLKKLEPKGASEEIEHHPEHVRKAIYSKVFTDTARGILAIICVLMLITVLGILLFQQYQLIETTKEIEANRQVALDATDTLSDISVFAAYCAKLPENNTVASIQQCIEEQIKTEGKK